MSRWYEDALCATESINFHSEDPEEIKQALDLCAQCPVRKECLTEAINRGDVHGVWGGTDEITRRRALGVDHEGKPRDRVTPPTCLWCGSMDIEEGPPQRTRKLMTCENCDFSWYSRVSPKVVEMQVTDGRSLSSDDVGRAVLPGDEESGIWDT